MSKAIAKCSRAVELANAWTGDPADKHQRLVFLSSLFGQDAYVKGETTYELAALWGLSDGTISNDAGLALHMARAIANPEAVRETLWSEVYATLEESKALRAKVQASIENAESLEPRDWQSISGAWAKFDDSVGKSLDRIATFAGIIKNTAVNTQVNVGTCSACANKEPPPQWLRERMASVDPADALVLQLMWSVGKQGTMEACVEEYCALGERGKALVGV